MSFDDFDEGPVWNEFQWEAHLNEIEERSEQLRRFITSDPKGNTPRWILLLQESLDEDDAVEAFIEEELLLDDAYFPEDEDDWEDEDDDWDDDDFFFRDGIFPFRDEDDDDDDFDYGEDWKELSDDFTLSEYGSIENLMVYQHARLLAVDVLKWAETIPPNLQTRQLHEFVSHVLKITSKLAGGYSFGFDMDVLGGNIAYTKKALNSANEALAYLQSMKREPFVVKTFYSKLHSRLFEIRNDTGIYIQELRDRFQYGME
jgi:hypothetical protein